MSVVSVAWDWRGGGAVALPFDQGMLPDKPHIPAQVTIDELMMGDPNLGQEEWDRLLEWISRQWIVMHNAHFDTLMMQAGTRVWGGGIDLTDRVAWDTMLAARVLDPLRSAALKTTAMWLWGAEQGEPEEALEEYLKSRRWDRGKMDLVPWGVMEPYATKDAEMTLRLWEYQRERLAGEDAELAEACDHEMKLCRVLTKMESRGVGFDVEGCRRNAKLLEEEIEKTKKVLPFATTPKGAKEYFFGKGYGSLALLPSKVTTVKGDPVLDIETLRRFADEGQSFARELAYLRNCESALSKWYANWPALCGADGRLRTRYNQANVVSGRLSVQRVQLQALPHSYRLPSGVEPVKSLIVPKEGHVLINADVSQAEIRVATAISGCKAMRRIVEGGGDIHGETTKLVFEVDESSSNWGQMRNIAKRINFGTLYGAGADKMRSTIEEESGVVLSRREMEDILQAYHSRFPEFRELSRRAENRLRSKGYVKLINGRRRAFGSDEDTHKAMNQIVQGNVAVAVGMWMIGIERALPGALILQVHDSALLELPDDGEAEEKARQVCRGGEQGMGKLFGIPFKIDYSKWGS